MANFRPGGDALGLHRVVSPLGQLPQAADKLDNSSPAFESEVWLDVDTLNIDAASFVQLESVQRQNGTSIAQQIQEIVDRAGKMHNPVTGSGGMLLGRVRNVGKNYTGPLQVPVGTRIATLVSLTLTPLKLDQIVAVHEKTHQVQVIAQAFLPSSAPAVAVPLDLPPALVLSVLDVAGAPAIVDRLVQKLPHNGRLLVIGAGKAGALSLAAARQARPDLRLIAVDLHESPCRELLDAGLCDAVVALDAGDAVAMRSEINALTDGQFCDAVVNMASLPGTEMAAILACKSRGTCLFFGMATSFTRVALGAEGVGADIDLIIGHGYADGHAQFALDLLRTQPKVAQLLRRRLGL